MTEDARVFGPEDGEHAGRYPNVRDVANVNGAKLGELKDRESCEVYGPAGNGWALIQQGSLRGWVNGKYLADYSAKPDLTRILKLKSPNMRGEDVLGRRPG